MIAVTHVLPNGSTMRGYETDPVPDLELTTVSHPMPNGSVAIEILWLPVAQPPAPVALDPATVENQAAR